MGSLQSLRKTINVLLKINNEPETIQFNTEFKNKAGKKWFKIGP